MNVIYTTPELAHPSCSGPQLRVETSIKALARVSKLHIYSRAVVPFRGPDQNFPYYSRLCQTFTHAPSTKPGFCGRVLRKLGVARVWAKQTILRDARGLVDLAHRHQAKIVWFGYGNVSYPLIRMVHALDPSLQLVCDTDSVWSRFLLRELPFISNPFKRLKISLAGFAKEAEERELSKLCDIITGVSSVDCDYYRSISPSPGRVHLFSNVVDLEAYSDRPSPPAGFHTPCIYLAGSFFSPTCPMVQAAKWLTREILPLVAAQIPSLHCYIIGSGSQKYLRGFDSDNVTVAGKVPSVLPYLTNATVAVVPLKFESGTRFKILEASACEIPVVSTTLGAEGLPVTPRLNILVADDSQSFAQAIIELVQTPGMGSELGRQARRLIQQQFSVESLSEQALAIFASLDQASGSRLPPPRRDPSAQ